ncbi:MAG: hypothetical protein ABFE01_04355, partial [Phycisphaerales bacterium]
GLAAPSPQIRIPTPVTVHVENCPQCAEDLATIREFGLTAAQLKRLGEFYSLTATGDLPQDEWMPSAAALAAFSFDETHPEDLARVSRSPQARKWVYEQRAEAAAALKTGPDRDSVLRCREVTAADLFDFVLPFGLDAETLRRSTGRHDAVGTHVRRCRACMERAQSLHQAIYGIAERADSAISTVYQCEKDAGDVSEKEGAPHRYPVDVWIVQDQRVPADGLVETSSAGNPKTQPSRVPAKTRPWLLKGSASLAAAVVLVASLSFIMNAAQGISFRDLRKSVRQAPNVYVKSFSGNVQSPVYEVWLSRELNKLATKSKFAWEVVDLNAKTRLVVDSQGDSSTLVKIDRKELGRYRSYLDQDNLFADAPNREELSEVPGDSSNPSAPRLLTYEILQKTVSGTHLWKVFIDPATQLPTRTEFFEQASDDDPAGTVELTYPTRAEMEAKFRELATSK